MTKIISKFQTEFLRRSLKFVDNTDRLRNCMFQDVY